MNTALHARVGLKRYYSSVRGLVTAIAAVALPYASKIVGTESAAFVFPPLGAMDGVARLVFLALCLGVSLGVYFLVAGDPPRRTSRVIWVSMLGAIVCACAYLAAYQRFVVRVDIPSRETSVHVSVGYERTPFSAQVFGSASDREMLRTRGTDEEEIERLWTMQSIIVARLALYLSFVLTSLAFLFIFSFAVAHDVSSQPPSRTGGP